MDIAQRRRIITKPPMRFIQGAVEPMGLSAMAVAKVLSAGEPKGTFLGDLSGSVNRYWDGEIDEYNDAKREQGFKGEDVLHLLGTLFSPVNALFPAPKAVKKPPTAYFAEGTLSAGGKAATSDDTESYRKRLVEMLKTGK